MANGKPVKFNLVRIVSEYFMMKQVLQNEDVQNILNGNVQSAGTNAFRDEKTLKEMYNYVSELGQMKISSKTVKGKAETFDAFTQRLMQNYIAKESAKQPQDRADYSENPFEDGFVNLVSGILSMEKADEKIKQSLAVNAEINDKIAALPVLLGGKKQSSYVKLLSQYTEIYSNISALKQEIAQLSESSGNKDAQIADLQQKLKKEVGRAREYKKMINQILTGTDAKVDEMKAILTLLSESVNNLDQRIATDVAVQGRATRKHVTAETNRGIAENEQNLYKVDQIKKQMLENPKMYPRYISVTKGMHIKLKNGSSIVYEEVRRAAASVNIPADHPAVDHIVNELVEKNYANGYNPEAKKGHTAVKVVAGVIGGVILAGALFTAGYAVNNYYNGNTLSAATAANQEMQSYNERESQQAEDFATKLNEALENGTFYSQDNSGALPFTAAAQNTEEGAEIDLNNPSVMDYNYFQALRNHYAQDDNVDQYKWSSTNEIDALMEAAKQSVRADYYEANYSTLLGEVADLNSQIDDLTSKLGQANSTIDDLQAQIDALQNKISELQQIIDAANEKYDADTSELQGKVDDLQDKLDAANEQIETLQNENSDLKAENAQLKSQVNNLTADLSDLLEEINRLKLENSVLSVDKAELQTQIYRCEIQIQKLEEKISLMQDSEKSELVDQIQELQELLEKANNSISELQSTNEALTKQVTELEGSIESLNGEIENLENSIKSLNEENTSLKGEVESVRNELTETANKYNDLLEKYNQLKESGSGASSEELEALRTKLTESYNTISNYENKIVALYNGLTKSNTASTEAMNDLEQLLDLFGINYSDKGAASFDSSNEYQPGA